MSEREFETYLTLLCRLLRLDAKQREAIARELRDHLEERLAELNGRGVGHDEAVRLALEEFGDAAGLAADFSWIAQNVRRRWLVRATLGSTVAALLLVMAALAFWPDSRPGPTPSRAVAQETKSPATPQVEAPAASAKNAAEGMLTRRVDAEFIEVPLGDVLTFLADAVEGQFYVNHKRLQEAEISLDAPVTLDLQRVRLDMLLDLALGQASDNLAYMVRDGIVIVSTLEDLEGAAEVRVYNVRDLVKFPVFDASGALGDLGEAAYPGGDAPAGSPVHGRGGFGGMSEMSGHGGQSPEMRAQMLIQVIIAAVGQKHWRNNDDYGTIVAYDGLLVVNHHARIHHQVERLLEMMRATAREGHEQGVK